MKKTFDTPSLEHCIVSRRQCDCRSDAQISWLQPADTEDKQGDVHMADGGLKPIERPRGRGAQNCNFVLDRNRRREAQGKWRPCMTYKELVRP